MGYVEPCTDFVSDQFCEWHELEWHGAEDWPQISSCTGGGGYERRSQLGECQQELRRVFLYASPIVFLSPEHPSAIARGAGSSWFPRRILLSLARALCAGRQLWVGAMAAYSCVVGGPSLGHSPVEGSFGGNRWRGAFPFSSTRHGSFRRRSAPLVAMLTSPLPCRGPVWWSGGLHPGRRILLVHAEDKAISSSTSPSSNDISSVDSEELEVCVSICLCFFFSHDWCLPFELLSSAFLRSMPAFLYLEICYDDAFEICFSCCSMLRLDTFFLELENQISCNYLVWFNGCQFPAWEILQIFVVWAANGLISWKSFRVHTCCLKISKRKYVHTCYVIVNSESSGNHLVRPLVIFISLS